jgi:hypothetical protein
LRGSHNANAGQDKTIGQDQARRAAENSQGMKKNAVGLVGIGVAVVVVFLMASMKVSSYARASIQFDGALIVVILGLIAAVRGSWLWLIVSAIGIAEVALILFR